METKKVTKWYWVWDYEKEELWLNAMAQEGWALQRVGFATYYFERTEPGEYEVRLECRKADDAYISFVQETGGGVSRSGVHVDLFPPQERDGSL